MKKLLQVLLVAVILSSGFASTALASGQATGYIQILSTVDPNIPMQAQVETALQPLQPDLDAALSAGRIAHYEPLYDVGVLEVVYDAASSVPDIAGRTVYSQIADAMPSGLPALGASLLNRGSSTGDLTPMGGGCPLSGGFYTVSLSEGGSYSAVCLSAGQEVQGSVRDGSGNVLAVSDDTADGTGAIARSAFQWAGSINAVKAGFTVTFKQWNGASWDTFSQVVPSVKFTSIDRAHAVVVGKAAPSQFVVVNWDHPLLNSSGSDLTGQVVTTASATGSWSVDFGATPMRGGDLLTVFSYPGLNFAFGRGMQVPRTSCELGGTRCTVAGFAGKPAKFEIIQGTHTYDFSGRFSEGGYFSVNLVKPNGSFIVVKAGNKVTGNTMPQYKMPKLTANIDYASDVVGGISPANKYLTVTLLDTSGGGGYVGWPLSSASGLYGFDFTSSVDLNSTLPYYVELGYTHPSTGNLTSLNRAFAP